MADQEYERDEQLLEARRLRRLEMKRKRMIRQRILLGVVVVIVVALIVLIAKSCGKDKTPDEPVDPPPSEPTTPVEPPEPKTTTATLTAVGDIMVYDSQLEDAKKEDGTYDFLPALAPVSTLLTAADVTVGNFEANFAAKDYIGFPDFRVPTSLAKTLAGLGFDVLQTANTYSVQNGGIGLTDTINAIREQGMNTLGTYLSADDKQQNQVVVREANGVKMAFIGFTKGVNNLSVPEGTEYSVDLLYTDYANKYSNIDRAAITQAVEAAKAAKPDVIIAMLHWGTEYMTEISDSQEAIANLLIDNGVDVILGTHPHIVGPMEKRTVTVGGKEKDVFIAYSLGNFMAAMDKNQPYTSESVALNLEFTKDVDSGETTISKIDYVPLYIMDNGAETANRYTVRNVYDVLSGDTDEATAAKMQDAINHLKANTGSTFDRGR